MRTLGLEIGSRLVRVVVGDNRRGRLQLFEAAALPLNGEGADVVASAIGAFWTEHGRGVQQVVVSLPLRESIVKLLRFPATSEDNLARLARSAADTALPLPTDQIRFDHAVVDTGDGGEATVALAACRRTAVSDLLDPLTSVGVPVSVVDVPSLALANVFAGQARELGHPVGILELGDDEVQLVVLDGKGRLRQVRTIAVDPAEIAEEVRRTCQSVGGTLGEPVAELLLVGPGAADSEAVLADVLPMPVRVGDPWAGNGAEAGLPGHAASYAVATGLALRGGEVPLRVNLKQVDAPVASRPSAGPAVVALVVIVLALVSGLAAFAQSWRNKEVQAKDLEAKVTATQQQLKAMSGEDPVLLQTLEATAKQVRAQSDWLDFLRELSLRLPGGVALDQLTCDRGRPVVLRGQAYSNALIAQTMDVLNGLGRFDTVRLDYANAQQVGQERVYGFQLTCPWRAATTVREAKGSR